MSTSVSSMTLSSMLHTTTIMHMPLSTPSSGSNLPGGRMVMEMNSHLTSQFYNVPLLFKDLIAKNKSEAFAIFILIIGVAFVYKLVLFSSWILEVKGFKMWNNDSESNMNVRVDLELQRNILPSLPAFMFEIFAPKWEILLQDLIRLILTFISTTLVYMLMLIVMTFVLTYVFGVILGLSLAEIFFNRCKIVLLKRWELQREIRKRNSCPGHGNCRCGWHSLDTESIKIVDKGASTQSSIGTIQPSNSLQNKSCTGCEGSGSNKNVSCVDALEKEKREEREAIELFKQMEQTGNMDNNIIIAENFK